MEIFLFHTTDADTIEWESVHFTMTDLYQWPGEQMLHLKESYRGEEGIRVHE